MALALAVTALLFLPGCAGGGPPPEEEPREALLYVNGEGIGAEELALTEGEDEAVRMKVLQQWGVEAGLAQPFDYGAFLAELEAENADRARREAAGEPVYGLVTYTPRQYYRVTMSALEAALREEAAARADGEDLAAWYEAHREDFRVPGAVRGEVTVHSGRSLVRREEVTLDRYNYRALSEENEALVTALSALAPGEREEWTDELGLSWAVTCLDREPDSYEPLEEVAGAAAQQYAAEAVTRELERRVAESTLEDLRETG